MVTANVEITKGFFEKTLDNINQSKYFFGFLMILLNMGAKYIELDLVQSQKTFLSSKLIRRLLIFTIAFIATRDFMASLIITSAFIILVLNLFHTESKYCILPKSFTDIDTNKDGKISPEEIKKAYETLKKDGKIK